MSALAGKGRISTRAGSRKARKRAEGREAPPSPVVVRMGFVFFAVFVFSRYGFALFAYFGISRYGSGDVFRTLVSAFLVFRLECRKLTVTWEDVLTAWIHRPAVEIVLEDRHGREQLVERIDEVYPF